MRGIHRSPVNSPHKGQWRGALMFSLICVWINGWVNNSEAGDLRCYRAHYDVIVVCSVQLAPNRFWRMGHGRLASTQATAVDGEKVRLWSRSHGFETTHHHMKRCVNNWHLPAASARRHVLILPLHTGEILSNAGFESIHVAWWGNWDR